MKKSEGCNPGIQYELIRNSRIDKFYQLYLSTLNISKYTLWGYILADFRRSTELVIGVLYYMVFVCTGKC